MGLVTKSLKLAGDKIADDKKSDDVVPRLRCVKVVLCRGCVVLRLRCVEVALCCVSSGQDTYLLVTKCCRINFILCFAVPRDQ